ncbi:hypothetical protein [Georgenia faecalis]|uniref:Uncharacterized protein n=1 Tax=Georgenia faecalis TaxID=2483799 RepID=A0ABV9DC77_9MICO|nr:hypothetical protein [Georgenia faecalis]
MFVVPFVLGLAVIAAVATWYVRHPRPARGVDPHRARRRTVLLTAVPVVVLLYAAGAALLLMR